MFQIKKLFRESFKVYKDNFFSLAFVQFALFFSSLFFLIFVKNRLADYMTKIQAFEPILQQILNTLDATNPASIAQSTTIIESMNQVTNNAVFFTTIVVPIVLLVFWGLFQALFWSQIKNKLIKEKWFYLLKIAVPSGLVLFFVLKFIALPDNFVEFFNTFDTSMFKILVSAFITLYFLTIYYAVLNNQSFTDAVKRTFSLALKKFYKFIPLYIPLFINTIAIIWLMAVTITQDFVKSFAYLSLTYSIILIIITLNISKYYKILFQKIVDKN